MNELLYKEYIIHNDVLYKSREIDLQILGKPSFYELIAIIGRKPLFLEDHLSRLMKSTKLHGIFICLDTESIRGQIRLLCEKNSISDGYVKMIYYFNESKIEDSLFFCVKHFNPSEKDYKNGIKLTYLSAERNIPNVKLTNLNLRSLAEEIKQKENVFEVLLVDKNGFVTEGSRSNLFVIKEDVVITPPTKTVLEGVTRKQIIEICKKHNIKLIERKILKEELEGVDALFITGTSSRVLPANSIGNTLYEISNELINKIMILYEEEIKKYLREK